MLITERQLSRRKKLVFPQPTRMRKVRKGMGAIKHVLGERKRYHIQCEREWQLMAKGEQQQQDGADVEMLSVDDIGEEEYREKDTGSEKKP
jgi:Mitochondrial 39-S ribosomal protein L47 (MRP-L47)